MIDTPSLSSIQKRSNIFNDEVFAPFKGFSVCQCGILRMVDTPNLSSINKRSHILGFRSFYDQNLEAF